MGVNGVLPRILPSAGRKIDLRQFRNGILVDDDDSSNGSNVKDYYYSTHSNKRQKSSTMGTEKQSKISCGGRRRRKLRIGLDVSGWISKACHGYGSTLLDERHLSNYGRSILWNNQNSNNGKNSSNTNTTPAGENNNNIENADTGNTTTSTTTATDKQNQTMNVGQKVLYTDSSGNVSHVDIISKDDCYYTIRFINGMEKQSTNENIRPLTAFEEESQEIIQRQFITQCVSYVTKRIMLLKELSDSDILVVLDGDTPPIKKKETSSRRLKRDDAAKQRDDINIIPSNNEQQQKQSNDDRIKAAKRAGASSNKKKNNSSPFPYLQSTIVGELLSSMRVNKISFLVSPYEADGQLSFLSRNNYIDLVVTEDSDLIGHGAKTILYKLNLKTNNDNNATTTTNSITNTDALSNQQLNYGDHNTPSCPCDGIVLQRHDLSATSSLDLVDFSNAMLAVMFVAAGCDYCSSLKGVGIVTARNVVKLAFHRYESYESVKKSDRKKSRDSTSLSPPLQRVLNSLYEQSYEKNMSSNDKKEYERKFLSALLMFRHPIVYDPKQRKYVISNYPPHPYNNEGDLELLEYKPYSDLLSNKHQREQVIGKTYVATAKSSSDTDDDLMGSEFSSLLESLIVEGWINPRTKHPYDNDVVDSSASRMPPEVREVWDNYSKKKQQQLQQQQKRNDVFGKAAQTVPVGIENKKKIISDGDINSAMDVTKVKDVTTHSNYGIISSEEKARAGTNSDAIPLPSKTELFPSSGEEDNEALEEEIDQDDGPHTQDAAHFDHLDDIIDSNVDHRGDDDDDDMAEGLETQDYIQNNQNANTEDVLDVTHHGDDEGYDDDLAEI